MSKKLINLAELYNSAAFGMSQATVETELGLVFVSGQVDWNHQYETTENSVEGQMRKALDNLKIALTAAGSSVEKENESVQPEQPPKPELQEQKLK